MQSFNREMSDKDINSSHDHLHINSLQSLFEQINTIMRLERVLAFFTIFAWSHGKSYEGYKTYEVTTNVNSNAIEFLKDLQGNKNIDFWTPLNKIGRPVDVMVTPIFQKYFEDSLTAVGIPYRTKIENVGSVIETEKLYHASRTPLAKGRIAFDQYLRHDEINAYLAQLAEDYPELVNVTSIGLSYENRSMDVIRISSGPRDPPKPVIFIAAGIHAREWIAPSTALYFINQLVENSETNSNLLEDADWVILPSFNPDGYEFTWTEDRMWRKTLSKGDFCDGVDSCRNFDYHWGELGADDFECSEVYAGKIPFSEIESRNVRDAVTSIENIKVYLSLHSYSQLILYPYSYDYVLADNWREHKELGDRINDAIKSVNGTEYDVISGADLYPASGTDDDWAKGAANISLVFVIELPGRGVGFDPPASAILPVGVETFEGLKVLYEHVAENYQ